MKSKLEELIVGDETFGTDAKNVDTGIMVNERREAVTYMILEYENRFDVYLNLYDEGEPPYRNILVKGSSSKLKIAKNIATRKLNKEAYEHLN